MPFLLSFLRDKVLFAVVFITGAAVLVLEVAATRILAPYFGSTIYTVSSILGVILFALSVGYYLGGRLADRYPSLKIFYGTIFLAGVSVWGIHFLRFTFLAFFSERASWVYGPPIAVFVLFFLPSVLLGVLSPFVIRLQIEKAKGSSGVGAVSGAVFFWSTLGSIVGSFLAGFYLIPSFAVTHIILGVGVLLVSLGLLGGYFSREEFLPRNLSLWMLTLLTLSLVLFGGPGAEGQGIVYEGEGVYEHIKIQDVTLYGKPARLLKQNTNFSAARYHGSEELPFEYTKYFSVAPLFLEDVKKALVIGSGAFSIPRGILEKYPKSRVDVVDIEPGLMDLAEKYFEFVPDDRVNNIIADGRRALLEAPEPYDLIFADIYYAPVSLPAHAATREFFELVRSKLTSEGVFAANVIGFLPGDVQSPSLIYSLMKTFRAAFPHSYFFALEDKSFTRAQNFIFLGSRGDARVDFLEPGLSETLSPALKDFQTRLIDLSSIDFSKELEFTDDYAPTEHMVGALLKRL